MPHLNGSGPEDNGQPTGRKLGLCIDATTRESPEKLGKGMGLRRKSGGGQGWGKRLKSGKI